MEGAPGVRVEVSSVLLWEKLAVSLHPAACAAWLRLGQRNGSLGVGGSEVPKLGRPYAGSFLPAVLRAPPSPWLSSGLHQRSAHHSADMKSNEVTRAGGRRSCQDRLAGGSASRKSEWACWQEASAQCCQLRRAALQPSELVSPATRAQGPGHSGLWGWRWPRGLPWV